MSSLKCVKSLCEVRPDKYHTIWISVTKKNEVTMKVRKAVIPVAGLGTRFLPATKAIPKEMLTIVDRPTIQYIVEEAVASGIDQIVFVTSEGKSAIENHFDYNFHLDAVLKEADAGTFKPYSKEIQLGKKESG